MSRRGRCGHHARELAGSAALVPVTTDPVTGAVLARHEAHTDTPPTGADGQGGRTPEQLAEVVRRLVELFRRPDGPSGQPGTDPERGPGAGVGVGVGSGTGVGVHTVESQYRPSAGLSRFIRSRFTGCAAPTSATWATDIEHPAAWPDGPTAGNRTTGSDPPGPEPPRPALPEEPPF